MLDENVIRVIIQIAEKEEFSVNPCFFLYDSSGIREKIERLSQRPENVSVYYAMKANPNRDIISYLRTLPSVNGIEIASAGELEKILPEFCPGEIIFTGPGKTVPELNMSIEERIKLINLESVIEAKRISIIAKSKGIDSVDVLLRINTDYYLNGARENMAGSSTHMGIDQKVIIETIKQIRGFKNINIRGYHVFSASGVLDYSKLLNYVAFVFNLNQDIENESGITTEIIDFGGGFGIDYSGEYKQFNIDGFFSGLRELIRKYDYQDKELILELGTYIVGDSGYYVSEIIDIKETKGKKHIVAAGGTNHLRLPIATGNNQPTYILPRNKPKILDNQISIGNEVVNVCGPLCYAEDTLTIDVMIEQADIGDLVVVSQAGAYGQTVSAVDFLSHKRAPEYLVNCRGIHLC